jgi:hypothetical protein
MKHLLFFFFIIISFSAFSRPEDIDNFDRCWKDKEIRDDPNRSHLAIGWTDCDVSDLGSEGTSFDDQEDEYYNDSCREEIIEYNRYSGSPGESNYCQHMESNNHYSEIHAPLSVPGYEGNTLKEDTAQKPEAYIQNYELDGETVDCEFDSLYRWHETLYLDRLGWSPCIPEDSDIQALDKARILKGK